MVHISGKTRVGRFLFINYIVGKTKVRDSVLLTIESHKSYSSHAFLTVFLTHNKTEFSLVLDLSLCLNPLHNTFSMASIVLYLSEEFQYEIAVHAQGKKPAS